MTRGNLHPADEAALGDIVEAIRAELVLVPPGGTLAIRISREKGGRLSPDATHIERRTYPLQDPPSETA